MYAEATQDTAAEIVLNPLVQVVAPTMLSGFPSSGHAQPHLVGASGVLNIGSRTLSASGYPR
tara:strand:- start:234 stop:419 length:186 start_codon:yes stop_codon:yes gene_type:complete